MEELKTRIQLSADGIKILITSTEGRDVLKAWFPDAPLHPRALLTLLEGVALWSKVPLYAAFIVEPSCPPSFEEALFRGELSPELSPLVRYDFVLPRRTRIQGVGDFKELRF